MDSVYNLMELQNYPGHSSMPGIKVLKLVFLN